MAGLNTSGDPPNTFATGCQLFFGAVHEWAELFHYCKKERKSPQAFLTCAVLMGNVKFVVVVVHGVNSFQKSHF